MENVLHQHAISEKNCFLSFNLEETHTNTDHIFDWTAITSFLEPFKILRIPQEHQPQRYSLPQSKFKSNCWTTIVNLKTAASKDKSTLNNLPGNPIQDNFIFISENETSLLSHFEQFKILDKFSHKYGMVLNPEEHQKIQYFVEPNVYTGKFIKVFNPLFKKSLTNLNGRTLRVSYIIFPPYMFRKANGELIGIQKNLLDEIAAHSNATFKYVGTPKTRGFGNLLPNGSWTGLVGELVEGRADVITNSAPTFTRYPVFTFTTPEYLESLIFCVKLPQPIQHWQALVYPLSPLIWLLTLVFFIAFIFLFILMDVLDQDYSKESAGGLYIIGMESALVLYAMLMDQPGLSPKAKGISRMNNLMWIFFCFMMGIAYKGNLVGYLTFTEKSSVPTTFSELEADSRYTIILQGVGGMELELFRHSPNPVMKGIAKRMTINLNTTSCLIAAATNEFTACLAWSSKIFATVAKYSASDENIHKLFIASQDTGGSAHGGLALRKNLIFAEQFIKYVGVARASALVVKWYSDNLRKIEVEAKATLRKEKSILPTDTVAEEDSDTARVLTTTHLFVVFLLIAVGFSASVLGFIGEHIMYRVVYRRNGLSKMETVSLNLLLDNPL
ncbi:unnamed protein product [Orchesella dallaii]|uniref:Ionotropic glutamate receptor L-glutamate and glycine-binding domain-containing protein n=1 Tax=Orchesella dallaii TaxID=48710 RepID=A0ABP1R4T3_9HEXA